MTTESGEYNCAEGTECTIDIVDAFFDEHFVAVPAEGHEFKHWKKVERGLCGNSTEPCHLSTVDFDMFDSLMALLDTEDMFYLEAEFAEKAVEGVGFEMIEVVSPT